MKGAILMEGERFYTDMRRMLTGVKNVTDYNWLITDCLCYPKNARIDAMLSEEYCFLSGEELLKLVKTENFQWIWAVLSAFKKDIPLEKILTFALPYADGYDGFWEDRITIQHPMAEIELVAYDSSLFLMIARNYHLVKHFMKTFPLARDLKQYNLENFY
ncbi:MAG TPA: hypothetical protein GXZ61_01430 [Clostridiales bacterium]|jgi:hypothetical protein|nr:hypothetical protein [Clostridiales bacterium]